MKVVSLIGPSGTGKSYRALIIARDRGIDYIIDDGLLIKGNSVIAGISAKREPTKVAAIRRALFMDMDHRKTVSEAIKEQNPDKLLILSTSEKMTERIVQVLGLPPVSEKIDIKDIATEGEINLARQHRLREGKHVIPVPTFEIRKDFSGYFLDTLKIFKKRGRNQREQMVEKSVVRPTFSYLGKYTISNGVIISLVAHGAKMVPGVHRAGKVAITSINEGIIIDIDLIMVYGYPIRETAFEVQKVVRDEVGFMTSINILQINVTVKTLVIQ